MDINVGRTQIGPVMTEMPYISPGAMTMCFGKLTEAVS